MKDSNTRRVEEPKSLKWHGSMSNGDTIMTCPYQFLCNIEPLITLELKSNSWALINIKIQIIRDRSRSFIEIEHYERKYRREKVTLHSFYFFQFKLHSKSNTREIDPFKILRLVWHVGWKILLKKYWYISSCFFHSVSFGKFHLTFTVKKKTLKSV